VGPRAGLALSLFMSVQCKIDKHVILNSMLACIKSKQYTSLIIKHNISSYEEYKLTQHMNGCKAWFPQPKERTQIGGD
jgi:hypothetical protein